jgi:acetyl esterase/lipase
MSLAFDPEIAAELGAITGGAPPPRPAVGDWASRRVAGDAMFAAWSALIEPEGGVRVRDFAAPVPMRWYVPAARRSRAAVLYVHGGGMILASVAGYDAIVRRYVARSGVAMLVVDYRLAPEHPYPAPVDDCDRALTWLAANAAELDVDPSRVAIMGDSASAGLAAMTALRARDRGGPSLALQLLVYPMLDDRNTVASPALAPFVTWSWDDNITGWGALLPDARDSPARTMSLAGLPRTYLEVGQLDIFCAETVAYAQRLITANVAVELHVHPGAPHGFELFAPTADVSRRALADRVRVLASL